MNSARVATAPRGAAVSAAGREDTALAGTLHVVATPIGNLEDITLRALRVLREVAVIAAEDTRRTRVLLTHYGIATPLLSYREHNRRSSTLAILRHLQTDPVALVSDAGMPGISDPGAELIALVAAQGGRVEVVPGANAALTALVASGLPPAPFTFVGFLSRQQGDRRRHLAALATRPETLVIYEAPHRLLQTLRDLEIVLGDRSAAACRELTKWHEEIRRGPLSELRDHFTATPPRGEFVLVVAGGQPAATPPVAQAGTDVDAYLVAAMAGGADMRRAVTAVAAQSGLPRRAVYARWQELRRAVPSPDAAPE